MNEHRWIQVVRTRVAAPAVLLFASAGAGAQAIAGPPLVGMGDSIGEGVQAADAAWQTQSVSYLAWLGAQMGGGLPQPWIQTDLFGQVGSTTGRFRLAPADEGLNLAVSGADVGSLLRDRANAATEGAIDSETDLVLFPRTGSQIEIAEITGAGLIVCWIGNNDVLSAVTSFDQLDGSQMTPVAQFEADFREIATRLGAVAARDGAEVVLANIPDVTDIAYLLDRTAAERLVGAPVPLPDGHFTTFPGALPMRLLGDGSLANLPDFVLDPAELAAVRARIVTFNAIIDREAARVGMPVVDINAAFSRLAAQPPTYFGLPATADYMGGLFSMDGVHPSNLGHALIANEFIRVINDAYGRNIPLIPDDWLGYIFATDPSTDKDRDGRVVGRLGVGLLESILFIYGLSGDADDLTPG